MVEKGKDPYPENVAMNGYTNQFFLDDPRALSELVSHSISQEFHC